MDLMDSPLNRAHLCGRKANRLVAQENYKEAILCHGEAADLLKVALLMTQNEQVKLSLELQRGRHLQQQRLIRDTWKKGKLAKKPSIYTKETPLPPTQSPPATLTTSPKAIWCVAQESPQGCKAAKDDCTRLEEQSMAIADLRKALAVLLKENEKLLEENESLKVENARLKRDSYTDQQSPLLTPLLNSVEATQWPLLLDLPLLHLPPDLQEEIRLLWECSAGHSEVYT
ncbi:nuclear receptor binding factor 2a [Pygocentrus nattereri]|uniref:nuclear receptor binding factor 2a n=1 Tax=Pygocentrus nattereri TaxID=42514 RepID=UPI000814B2FD|nr:nuclear receptor binding factor 2a [Pygocentrus nattereri]